MKTMDLVAVNPSEMESSRSKMAEWAVAGKADAEAAAAVAFESYEHALTQGWSTRGLKAAVNRETKRAQFFEKVRMALEAGFYVVPPFWVDTFAVRLPEGATLPTESLQSKYSGPRPRSVRAKALPPGEGEYVGDTPTFYTWSDKDEEGNKLYCIETIKEPPAVSFPLAMAKPRIMERTTEAMALKVFDEIGIVRQAADPIIVGNIKHPKGNHRTMSFFVAWDFDIRGF